MRKTEETRHKMSLAKLGKPKSKETRIKMSKAHTGKSHSEETKRKISESMKKKFQSVLFVDPWSTND